MFFIQWRSKSEIYPKNTAMVHFVRKPSAYHWDVKFFPHCRRVRSHFEEKKKVWRAFLLWLEGMFGFFILSCKKDEVMIVAF